MTNCDLHRSFCYFLVQVSSMLSDLRNHQNARIDNAIQTRTQNLELIATALQKTYDAWIENLKKYRRECSLLQLFSNREIMILIVLLRTSNGAHSIRSRFLKNLFAFKNLNNQNEEEQKNTIHCLLHYLRSLRISEADLSTERLNELYQRHRIEQGLNTDVALRKLSEFLRGLFENNKQLFPQEDIQQDNQQFLVSLPRVPVNPNQVSMAHDLDLNTCCILLNIFQNRLPASYQILWCSNTTEEDIQLFFFRIRTFPELTFVIMDIDKMHHRLREILLNEQDSLARESKSHGRVFYFSKELTTNRKGLRAFQIPDQYKDSNQSHQHLLRLFRERQFAPSNIQIIYGKAGIGKVLIVQ
jgi:hypothetical protein